MKKDSRGYSVYGFRAMMIIVALTFSLQINAQNRGFEKVKRVVRCTVDFVDYVLNDVDTAYVQGNKYNLTIMPEYSLGYEHYRFGTTDGTGQCIDIAPDNRGVATFNVGWRWLIVGYSVDLHGGRALTEFNTGLYSTRFALDLFYRKSGEGYKIRNLSGFYNGEKPLQEYNNNLDGFAVEQIGIGLHYAFNKRFSYAAAYGQSTIQRASAGSFILGADYNQQKFTFNHDNIDPLIANQLQDILKFRNARYNDFSISLGYGYNWVFAKNFLAGVSFEPEISYKKATLEYADNKSLQDNINLDITTRAALVYNNSRYYAGASFESHSYLYDRNSMYIRNGFGLLEVYAGFFFWRR